jgi:hypothetical protein
MVGAGVIAILVAGTGDRGGAAEAGTRRGAWVANVTRATVVYDEVGTEIGGARVEGRELWVTTGDLTRATRFELKPQGVCRDELCFPLPKARRGEFVREDGGATWFDLTAFAELVGQPVARQDPASQTEGGAPKKDPGSKGEPGAPNSVWYFGLRADQRLGGLEGSVQGGGQGLASLEAPNFTLPDMAGKTHSLVDFRGKKVLLVTWASW